MDGVDTSKMMGWKFGFVVLGLAIGVACTETGSDPWTADDDDDGVGGAGSTSTSGAGGSTSSTSTSGTGGSSSSTTSGAGGDSPCANGPLAGPIPNCTPSPVPNSGDFYQDCVDRINQFRWECQCLPPLQRWTEAESCTDQQSSDDQSTGTAHGNFGDCGENAQNTCPDWGSDGQIVDGCLQMMWDEGPGQPFEEHGHYINMSSTSYGKVACGRSQSSGAVWSNQNFAP